MSAYRIGLYYSYYVLLGISLWYVSLRSLDFIHLLVVLPSELHQDKSIQQNLIQVSFGPIRAKSWFIMLSCIFISYVDLFVTEEFILSSLLLKFDYLRILKSLTVLFLVFVLKMFDNRLKLWDNNSKVLKIDGKFILKILKCSRNLRLFWYVFIVLL